MLLSLTVCLFWFVIASLPNLTTEPSLLLQDKASGHIAGQLVPSFWTAGKDFNMGNPSEQFEVGEVVVLNRSDGTIKFGLVQKLNEPQAGIHVVLVDCGVETNSVKTLQISDIGKVFLVIRESCALYIYGPIGYIGKKTYRTDL